LLFALGFAGALRRSELVGIDWQIRGSGTGIIVQDDRGLVITLLNTKTGKGEPEQIIIPCSDMPTACNALVDWISRAGVQPGAPLFRSVNKGGEIAADRLSDRSVARIIKKSPGLPIAAGRSEAEATELAELQWRLGRILHCFGDCWYPSGRRGAAAATVCRDVRGLVRAAGNGRTAALRASGLRPAPSLLYY
jgi:hypothetical protein